LKAFIAARKPGVYARVIAPGSVAAGQPLAVSQAHPACPLTDELFDLWHDATLRNKVALQRALDAPIASRARPAFLKWLASTHENQQSS
jgi:MOSC domain-containing protein YiiM